jgi:membrane protein required for colicin V production
VNWVDLTLISLFSLFGLRGYFKGLFREIFSLAGLVVGFMAAVHYNQPIAAILESYWEAPPQVHKAIAFVAVFFVLYLV